MSEENYWPQKKAWIDRETRSVPRKLNRKKVAAIRKKYAGGKFSINAIGRQYSVSRELIRQIINGTIWK